MVHLTIQQQKHEIQELEFYMKGRDDLEIVELQAQQIKRLIYFAKRGIAATKLNVRDKNDGNGAEESGE